MLKRALFNERNIALKAPKESRERKVLFGQQKKITKFNYIFPKQIIKFEHLF